MKDLIPLKRPLIALALSALIVGCFSDDKSPSKPPVDNTSGCVDTAGVVSEDIIKNCELAGDKTYRLKGLTFVDSGITLTIGAGAIITGPAEVGVKSALVIKPGAYIKAVGTKDKPIVFTAGTSSPVRGDFGGVIILGKAKSNFPGGRSDIEGLTGMPFGGSDDTDSSGVFEYVRIEYVGYKLTENNEINGLTMGGVGSKTKVSHVQVFEGLDDCFEWFGGAVSADHLVCTGQDDDMFDWDAGWSGSLQFALGVAGTVVNSDANGIEADNLNGTEDAEPRSAPKIGNITLIGNGSTSLNGMRLRRGTAGTISNALVTGFTKGVAVRIDGNASIKQALDGKLAGSGIYAFGNGGNVGIHGAAGLSDSVATVVSALAKVTTWLVSGATSVAVDAKNPRPGSAVTGAVDNPSGLSAAKYIGAFDASGTLWTDGWTKTLGEAPKSSSACIETGNKIALEIKADCTIPADGSYSMQGLTFVKKGTTLTIGAGARITGLLDASKVTALVVEPGAYIKAVGTKDKPIVFTSGTATPLRGDFGGVIILGNAKVNFPGGKTDIEGLTGVPYGGTVDADSSGELRYVRIEYVGYKLTENNELNGHTMGGVGSKTKVSFVQVYEGLDDCFEWFGGNVSASNLVCYGQDDDMFDWDAGWSGNLQFALGVARPITNTDANGIEADNLNGSEDASPRSNPKVANITLIGNGTTSLNGMRLRRGTAATISNAIVTGFVKGAAVRVDGNASIRSVLNDSLNGSGIYVYGNGSRVSVAAAAGLADSAITVAAAKDSIATWFASDTAALGVELAKPKPAAAAAGAVDNATGLVAAKYIGAFDPAVTALWTDGWIKGY